MLRRRVGVAVLYMVAHTVIAPEREVLNDAAASVSRSRARACLPPRDPSGERECVCLSPGLLLHRTN